MFFSKNRPATFLSLLISFFWLAAAALAQQAQSQRPRLEFRKWSGEINVPDPVSVSVDDQGRVYATQTRRRKIQDLDIRSNRDWIPIDVGLKSIEEKRDFLRQALAIGGDQDDQRRRVDDHNGDGQHDWRDLTTVSEVVYRLVDHDRDGKADEISIFSEDFKTEVTGIAAGVLAHQGNVYVTVAPDLWKLRDHNDDGVADSRESLAHGFGLHIAYAGHDMHGPTVGPDGKIYWSIGDKGINVTSREGRQFAYPNQGGVMRCNPDGSDFEVFAHGLRNVQEVAFDQYGNMFGVDNDADQSGERERFVYIVEGMDAGWRCNYQYRGDAYNPWTDEHLWELPGEEHPAYIVPPLAYAIDGPAGFKFNPGTALSPEYQEFFFLTGAPNGNQHAFRVQAAGDSFEMVDEHQFGSGIALVGLAFGPDGGLYGADWDGGYPLDEKGAVIRIDAPPATHSPLRSEVRELLAAGFQQRSNPELLRLLSHADQRVRQGAQFALVDRQAAPMLASAAVDESGSTLGRLHALWGLGQLARQGDGMCRDVLGLLLKAEDPRLRAQAAKTYGEVPSSDGYALVDLIDDGNPQVRTQAGLAVARHPTSQAIEPLWQQSAKLDPSEHYLRHAVVTALAACASPEILANQTKHENEMRRMCAVLALRRQAHPSVADYLNDPSRWVATEAARAIHDDNSILDALLALAESVSNSANQSAAHRRRAINANFRLGDSASAKRVLDYALQQEQPEDLRLEAVNALSQWLTPPLLDRVDGRRRDLSTSARAIDESVINAGLGQLAGGQSQQIRAAAVSAARQLGQALPLSVLRLLVSDESNSSQTRIEALDTLVASTEDCEPVLLAAFQSANVALQVRALELICDRYPQTASQVIAQVLSGGTTHERKAAVAVQQAAIAGLRVLPAEAAVPLLRTLVAQLREEQLDSALALDVWEAARDVPELADELPREQNKFVYARDGGRAEVGKAIFNTHVQAQCSRCHRIGKQGSEIGPELTQIAATRDADYLLRAIAQPSADIDAKYRTRMLLLASGEVVKGVVQSESDQETVLADTSGALITVAKDAIEESVEQSVSLMPEMSDILSPREVRDLVAYLRTLK